MFSTRTRVLFHAEQNILLIELLGGEYEQKHGIYQKARERAIEFQKLQRVHEALQAMERLVSLLVVR